MLYVVCLFASCPLLTSFPSVKNLKPIVINQCVVLKFFIKVTKISYHKRLFTLSFPFSFFLSLGHLDSISASFPFFKSFLIPIHDSGPSLHPPTKVPIIKKDKTRQDET